MSVSSIKAHLSCDECGSGFTLDLDAAEEINKGCLHDFVMKEVKNWNEDYMDSSREYSRHCGYEQGKILCYDCAMDTLENA